MVFDYLLQISYNGVRVSYKPMSLRIYERYVEIAGWSLSKGSIDYKLHDDKGAFRCFIKVTHGKNTKGNEIDARSVRQTENKFKEAGLSWPPNKK